MTNPDRQSVAVIIPTYNRARCLRRAVDSALAQSHAAAEICVVDDGSGDGTAAMMAREYPGVRYHWQPNRGVSAARNTGIRLTRSHWLAFLDSDDEWLPHKLARQLQAWSDQPHFRLIHSDEIWIRRGRRVNPRARHAKAGGNLFERCLPLCAISPSAVMLERGLVEEVGGFDESLPACEDYELWLRVCCRYPALYVNEPLLVKYGGHADQLSRRYWGMDRFRLRALDKLLDRGNLSPVQRRATLEMLAEKGRILLKGARKHGNETLSRQVTDILRKYDLRCLA